MEPNKCRVIQLGVSSICRARYCQWCVPTLLTTKPQRLHREHFPYLLLFLRNLCLSKANTLWHTRVHIHTHTKKAHMRLMNIAEQQVITHTSSVSLHCFYSLHTYRYAGKRQTRAGPRVHPHRRNSYRTRRNISHSHRITQAHSNLRSVPFFCLWLCDSGKPGCELTPPCFSRLHCYAWHLLCAHNTHRRAHIFI